VCLGRGGLRFAKPTVGSVGCCARVASGHATVALPKTPRRSRRLMFAPDPRHRSGSNRDTGRAARCPHRVKNRQANFAAATLRWLMSPMGHFRPIHPGSLAGRCPLCPGSDLRPKGPLANIPPRCNRSEAICFSHICIEPAIWANGSSTRSRTVAGSQHATTSWRRISFSLPRSGYGCASMCPRPKASGQTFRVPARIILQREKQHERANTPNGDRRRAFGACCSARARKSGLA
jgi:hypothetical protein